MRILPSLPLPLLRVFRTFPNRDLVLRGLLNADVVGFHTFDYARHFLRAPPASSASITRRTRARSPSTTTAEASG